jgi:hypothetical protein
MQPSRFTLLLFSSVDLLLLIHLSIRHRACVFELALTRPAGCRQPIAPNPRRREVVCISGAAAHHCAR